MSGIGGEFSVVGFKPNVRMWISRTKGFEVFGGVTSELSDFIPNDFEGGFKYLNSFLYNRTDRTYFGLVGKWKWVNLEATHRNTNLPVVGVMIGKEWFHKHKNIRAFAIELGYQYGAKEYEIQIDPITMVKKRYDEFPLVLNLRYSLYKKK
jgi:hypothetical protein